VKEHWVLHFLVLVLVLTVVQLQAKGLSQVIQEHCPYLLLKMMLFAVQAKTQQLTILLAGTTTAGAGAVAVAVEKPGD
jgi:hypothetical protein